MPEILLKWDEVGEKLFETGVDRGVLYLPNEDNEYVDGVAWNGLTGYTESPSGADSTDLYANNSKYLSMTAAETYGATIEAYMCPREFYQCDGSAEIAPGVFAGQQNRKMFGFSCRTILGNDVKKNDFGYKLHLVYGCNAAPSERAYSTVNESPDAMQLSWEINTTPVPVPGLKPTACLTIFSNAVDKDKLKQLETILYGSGETKARLPLPKEVMELLGTNPDQEAAG